MAPDTAEAFLRSVEQPYGAVLVCGPTGSGKTTTLYAALEHLNDESRVLMTIENPVERRIPGVNQFEVNEPGGLTFETGLRTILRSDPDVLLVGEVRDAETARIATQAALTGHLILTTVHAHSATGALVRLADLGLPRSLLAATLNGVLAQRLVRRLCPDCREPYEAKPDDVADAGFANELEHSVLLYRPRGCARCAGSGFDGRTGIHELLLVDGELRQLIETAPHTIFSTATANGMRTLRADGLRLCLEGATSLDEVRRVAGDRLR
jgi:type II secretory ATPase GspE/PulE/Tfp pilus assembly ATPase PilB-like protein